MREYDFTLKFALAAPGVEPDAYVERLGEEGCDDALLGIGQSGRIALDFTRTAASAHDAVVSALADVKRAIPDATPIEAAPDFVGVTDVASILGCSRQNVRKLMVNCRGAVPAPVHEGNPSVWHLAEVLRWLREQKRYRIPSDLLELAETAMQLNLAIETRSWDEALQKEMRPLVG